MALIAYPNRPNLAFKNISILIVDRDVATVQVLGFYLRAMGFSSMFHARNGEQALDLIRKRPIDLIITEWSLPTITGLDLVQAVRRDASISNRLLPIIMLTARSTLPDVMLARDSGVTEFLTKPFTAQTLLSHIIQVVEKPRSFVLSEVYVGPERRRRAPPPDGNERRVIQNEVVKQSAMLGMPETKSPILIAPTFALKERMGLSGSLSTFISTTTLEKAQAKISSMSEESLQWIRQDLRMLEESFNQFTGRPSPARLELVREAALALKSHAGTFGYAFATQVASQLHSFLGSTYGLASRQRQFITSKHIELLKVIFASGIRLQDTIGEELLRELQRLIQNESGTVVPLEFGFAAEGSAESVQAMAV